jgi:hypothetical protein
MNCYLWSIEIKTLTHSVFKLIEAFPFRCLSSLRSDVVLQLVALDHLSTEHVAHQVYSYKCEDDTKRKYSVSYSTVDIWRYRVCTKDWASITVQYVTLRS